MFYFHSLNELAGFPSEIHSVILPQITARSTTFPLKADAKLTPFYISHKLLPEARGTIILACAFLLTGASFVLGQAFTNVTTQSGIDYSHYDPETIEPGIVNMLMAGGAAIQA